MYRFLADYREGSTGRNTGGKGGTARTRLGGVFGDSRTAGLLWFDGGTNG